MTNFYFPSIYDQGHCHKSMWSATANSNEYLLFNYNHLQVP